jgi:hypothetical protein
MAAQLRRNVYRGPAPRTDTIALPTRAPGTRCELDCHSERHFSLQKDAVMSAGNALGLIWDDAYIIAGTCAWHSGPKWLHENQTFIKDAKKNLEILKNDFQAFKNCPTIELIPYWLAKMEEKWIAMGEGLVYTKWAYFYHTHRLTRIEMNEDNPLRGGYPNDNNVVEIQNGHDKLFRGHKRSKYIIFLDEFEFYLEDVSMRDLDYIGVMKQDVHSAIFYSTVHDIIRAHATDKPSILSLSFPFSSARKGIPLGSTIVMGEESMGVLLHDEDKSNITIGEAKACFRRGSKGSRMINHFKTMFNDPGAFCDDRHFVELGDWTRMIHLLRPLNPAMGASMVEAITGVWRMLRGSGVPVIDLADLLDRRTCDFCLVCCDCSTYQQRAWCKHSCATAMHRGIVTGYPTLKDPRPLNPVSKRGRPIRRSHPLVVDK